MKDCKECERHERRDRWSRHWDRWMYGTTGFGIIFGIPATWITSNNRLVMAAVLFGVMIGGCWAIVRNSQDRDPQQ